MASWAIFNGRVRQSHQLDSKQASALACGLCLLAGDGLGEAKETPFLFRGFTRIGTSKIARSKSHVYEKKWKNVNRNLQKGAELRSNKFAKCVKRWEIYEDVDVKMGGLVGQKLAGREVTLDIGRKSGVGGLRKCFKV